MWPCATTAKPPVRSRKRFSSTSQTFAPEALCQKTGKLGPILAVRAERGGDDVLSDVGADILPVGCDRGDFSALDGDVPHGVDAVLAVDDVAAFDQQVVFGLGKCDPGE